MAIIPPGQDIGTHKAGDFENPRRLYPLVTPEIGEPIAEARGQRWGQMKMAQALRQPRRLVRAGFAKREIQARDSEWITQMMVGGKSAGDDLWQAGGGGNSPPDQIDLFKLLGNSPTGPLEGAEEGLQYFDKVVQYDSLLWESDGVGSRDEQVLWSPEDHLTNMVQQLRCIVTDTWQAPLQTGSPTMQLEMLDRDGVQVDTDKVNGTQGSRVDWVWHEEIQEVKLVIEVPGDTVRNLTSGAVQFDVIYSKVLAP